jgi:polyhydroxyalkanoate synthesis regulator protein
MAIIRGKSDSDNILGLQGNDIIFARRGNDTVDGGAGNDRILADDGDDVLFGGEGDDSLFGENGNDTLDGGEGNDRVSGGRGDDTGIYRLAENAAYSNYYDGGTGNDTLRLVLTQAEANSADILADIDAFRAFLAQNNEPDRAGNPTFHFTSFDLTVRNWEKLEVEVEPEIRLPVLSINDAQTHEGGTLEFVVSVSKADPGQPITATYTLSFGPAASGNADQSDINAATPLTGQVTIAAGATQATILIPTVNDELTEHDEHFTVTLSDLSSNASAGDLVATGTILDNDLPSLSIADATATEGDPGAPSTTISFVVTRSGDNGSPSTVDYVVIPGSAGTPDDYTGLLSGTLRFAATETSKTITLEITADLLPEDTENFTVELSDASNATISRAVATGTILDNDLPTLSIADATATEGDPGAPSTTISFVVTRSGDNGSPSTVDYVVIPGSAGTPDDYTGLLSGTLRFAATETSKTITLEITADLLPEDTENFTVELSDASNATISRAVATGTILDNDLPTLSIADATATEGDPGDPTTTISFVVTRSGDNGSPSTVDYAVIPGSAGTPDDYTGLLSGTLSFAATETSKTITLDVTADLVAEGTENFTVELSDASNATISRAVATGTILDNALPTLSIADATATEGDPGAPSTTISFVVTRSGDNGSPSTVDYSVNPGSAGTPDDYTGLLSGTLSFAATETSKTITLDITADLLPEDTENFTVELSGASNATISRAVATGTILDNDLPTLSIADATATEGDPGAPSTTISFVVTRSGDNGSPSTVDYSVNPGSAGTPDDYTGLLSGTLSFAATETSKTITLDITADLLPEDTENFTVELSGASNATISRAVATGTILDNDLPTLSIADATASEGDPGDPTTTISFVVTRSGDNGSPSTVDYSVNPGSAGTPDDYTGLLSGTLSFAATEASKTITLEITADLLPEDTENFTVELSDASNGTITRAAATGTVIDDDAAPPLPTLSIADATAIEGNVLAFVVSVDIADLNNPITATYTIDFAPAGVGFADQSDLAPQTPLTGTATILAGQTSVLISVGSFDDQQIEVRETFTVSLSNISANAQPSDLHATGTIVDNEEVECGYSWGDPHYVTADGLIYDMQACGEFVLVETRNVSDPSPLTVQTRTALYGPNVSVNTAVATLVDGHRVTIDTRESEPLRIDGQVTTIASGDSAALGSGQIHYDGGVYSIVFPTQERLIVTDRGSYVDVRLCASADRPDGSLHGLLGNFDGNAANDLATRDGTVLPTQPTFAQLYDTFANSWRITQAESLFDYRAGESTATFSGDNCPIQKTSRASLPADKVAEAIALLDAAGITDPALREAAILDYALTCDPSFINSAGQAGVPSESVKVIDPTIIWTNGGQVIIGSADSPGQFDIGTSAPTPSGVNWTGATGSDNWSESENWSPDAPASTDEVVFDAVDADGRNLVDQDFTVAALLYTGEVAAGTGAADHITDFDEDSTLTVSGNATIGANNSQSRVNLTVANGTAVVVHVTELNVGYNATGSGETTGNLRVTGGASLDASHTDELSVGRVTNVGWQAKAEGSLVLGADSMIDVGTAAAPATLNIGWNQSTSNSGYDQYLNRSSATGLLDATQGTLNAELSELNVGLTAGRGTADGTLIMGDGTTISTLTANIGMGRTTEGGATGTLDFHGGSLTFAGTDSSLNFGTGSLIIADGVDFTVGDATDRLGQLRIAYNTSGVDLANTAVDLTNHRFTAYVANELSVGRVTNVGWQAKAEGSLALGADSMIDVGTAAAPATLNIGWNQSTSNSGYDQYLNRSSATGLLDATQGTLNAELSELNVGLTAGRGTADGTLIMGDGTTISTLTANIGMGRTTEGGATGTLDFHGGSLTFAGTDSSLNFGTGSLIIADGVDFTVGDATDRLGQLRIAYNTSGVDLANTAVDLTNHRFTAYVANELSVGRVTNVGWQAKAEGSLALGADSMIDVGTAAAPATLNIGWNQSTSNSGYDQYLNRSSATGLLDATQGTLNAELSELNVGLTAGRGTADGTLIMGDGTTISTLTANIGMGRTTEGGATGTLDFRGGSLTFAGTDSSLNFGTGSLIIADGVDFTVGDATDRLGQLRIAYNTSGVDLANTAVDLTNHRFTAYVANELSVGRVTNVGWQAKAEGSLVLGADSMIDVGTAAAPATLNIGWNQSTSNSGYDQYLNRSSATGLLDATQGTLNAELSELNVGLTAGRGTADGTLIMGDGTTISTLTANIGMGRTTEGGATGTLDFHGGSLTFAGTDSSLNFGTGSLIIADGVDFTVGDATDRLGQLRIAYNTSGVDLANTAVDLTNHRFTAYVANELSVGRVTNVGWQAKAEGSLALGADSMIDVGTAAAPATLNIGWNQSTSNSGYDQYLNRSSATGLLDATQGTLNAELSELNVGLTAGRGTADGTLIMGDGTTISTLTANIGMGRTTEGGATGTLDFRGGSLTFAGTDSSLNFGTGSLIIADGVDFTVGDATDRLGQLRIAYNTSGVDLANTAVDLTNHRFTAYVANELSVGRVTNVGWQAKAEGSLVLGADSMIDVGTAAAPATLNIGWNQSTSNSGYDQYLNRSSATGLLDATQGTLNAELSELNVGLTAGRGTADGTLIMGDGTTISTLTANIGMGRTTEGGATGTLDFHGGSLTFAGTDSSLNFGTGSLIIADGVDFTVGDATDRLGQLRIAYNTSGVDLANTAVDLTNHRFTAYVANELSVGRVTNVGWQAKAEGSLALGADSMIDVGTAAAPATLNIGWNQSTSNSGYDQYLNRSSATGLLDATQGTLNAELSELNVGLTAGRGTADGTLIMGDGTTISTLTANIGMGRTTEGGATGTLDFRGGSLTFAGTDSSLNFGTGSLIIADGVDFTVGDATDRLGQLRIAYNTSGVDLANTAVDLTNHRFTAYVANELSVGRVTNVGWQAKAEGSLVLGADSMIDVGTAAAPATLNIGWNQSTSNSGYDQYLNRSSATGLLDATQGTLNAELSELNVGLTAGRGTADGTLIMGDGTTISTLTANIGMGRTTEGGATGTLDFHGGSLTFAGTDSSLNFGTGSLIIADGVDFTVGDATDRLGQLRIAYNTSGVDLANTAVDLTNHRFTAYVANELSVGRVTNVGWQAKAEGSLALGADSMIDVGTAAAPATLNIGWNQSTSNSGYDQYLNRSSATGLLDATQGTLNAELSELNVGLTAGRGTADGTLIMGDGTTISTLTANIGMGRTTEGGATGTLDFRGGSLTFAGTGSSLNFGTGSLIIADGVDFTVGDATDRLGQLRIAYNTSGVDLANTAVDLTNHRFTAYVANELSVGRVTNVGWQAKAEGSLALGADSMIDVGTAAAPATLNIGWNQSTSNSGYDQYLNRSSATGLLDATQGTLNAELSELNVGLTAGRGTADGTLIMGDGTTISTLTANIGMGRTTEGGATGTLDFRGGSLTFAGTGSSLNFGTGSLIIADGVDFTVGDATDRLGQLRIAYNTSGVDLANTAVDLTNHRFTAYVANELSVGRVTNVGWQAKAEGSLALGADSMIDVGTAAAPATLNIGWNQSTSNSGYDQYLNRSSATGLLDATQGTLNAELSELNVGLTAGRGTADGTLIMGDGTTISTLTANIGMGVGATGALTLLDNFTGTFNAATTNLANGLFDFGNNTLEVGGSGSIATGTFKLSGGLLSGSSVNLTTGGSFDFSGGRLDVITFNGSLNEVGGTLAAGDTAVGTTTIDGDYGLSAAGTLEINLAGYGAGVGYDQLAVTGAVDLDGSGAVGGMLDLVLDFAAQLGDSFIIIDNEGADAIAGTFFELAEGGSLQEEFGGQLYSFAISYAGGDGNDVELTVTSIVASPIALSTATLSANSFAASAVISTGSALSDGLAMTPLVADADAAQDEPVAPPLDTLDAETGEPALADSMLAASFSEIVRFDTLLDALSDLGDGTQDPVFTSLAKFSAPADPWPISLAEIGATADAADAVEFPDGGSDGVLDFDAAASPPEDLAAAAPLPAFASTQQVGNVDFLIV